MNKITSFTHHKTAEGDRISFAYSTINESGEVTRQNARGDIIIVDTKTQKHIDALLTFLNSMIEE